MKRSNTDYKLTTTEECQEKIAFHEAGHAAAIYLRNRQLNLPPVYFQIKFNMDIAPATAQEIKQSDIQDDVAVIEGGCLIHDLSVAAIDSSQFFSEKEQHEYLQAFNADIVNSLAGPMAEAKYTAIRDEEWLDNKFDNIGILKHYGGSYDIAKINEYLHCMTPSIAEQQTILKNLLSQASSFINCPSNWYAITQLAELITNRNSNQICCEQIAANIDASMERWNSGSVLSYNQGTQFRNKNHFAA